MHATIPAHLRRSAALLRFVSEKKGDAEVVWCGSSLGTWESLRPSVRLSPREILLVVHSASGRMAFRVSTAHSTSTGAEIHLSGTHESRRRCLSLVWGERDAGTAAMASFEDCRECLKGWIRRLLPGSQILTVTRRSDRANTLSGSYFRIHARGGGRDILILASGRTLQDAQSYESALSQALLWATFLRMRRRLRSTPMFHLVVPGENAPIVQHRSGLLDSSRFTAEVWQYDLPAPGRLAIRRAAALDPARENREFRWPVLGPFQWSAFLARVLELAPSHIKRYPRFQEYDSLRLWGLEFATASGDRRDSIEFGVGVEKTALSDDNFEGLRSLVDEILYFRRPDTPDPRHPYYRLQAERWMEALILEEIPRLFPELVPESVYPQIPVYLGKDPGRVDILGADRDGTLVVLELKVHPDPDLPIQALDYWGRVVRHNNDGDFLRRGYFSGIRLNRKQPRVYLVSPVFSFHTSTEQVLGFFDPDVEVWKISINEDWRCGVRILRRTRLRCGDET